MTNGGRHDSLKTLSQVNTIVTIPAYFIVTILSIIKMFIETLEFTIPVELCSVFSNLQKAQKSNVEFPASVNSYGTTQDANIQVVLRSNKLTFKVDGVSSNSSMISKSECKTLKLSVFDVDSTLLPQEEEQVEEYNYNNSMSSIPVSVPSKRLLEQSVSLPPAKSSRTSYNNDSPRPRSPQHRRSPPRRSQNYVSPRPSENSQPKPQNDTPVNVKQEPEDPDLIEIEPDEIEPKKEMPYMQMDPYSSNVSHTQTSQSVLERLSHPQSSYSQSPGSSSSSFHQNVPHVPDYSEPGPSQVRHGDQSADDYLVFQDDDGEDNEADYSNDDFGRSNSVMARGRRLSYEESILPRSFELSNYPAPSPRRDSVDRPNELPPYLCPFCAKPFSNKSARWNHIEAIHQNNIFRCFCGKTYSYRTGLMRHQKTCMHFIALSGSKLYEHDEKPNMQRCQPL